MKTLPSDYARCTTHDCPAENRCLRKTAIENDKKIGFNNSYTTSFNWTPAGPDDMTDHNMVCKAFIPNE